MKKIRAIVLIFSVSIFSSLAYANVTCNNAQIDGCQSSCCDANNCYQCSPTCFGTGVLDSCNCSNTVIPPGSLTPAQRAAILKKQGTAGYRVNKKQAHARP